MRPTLKPRCRTRYRTPPTVSVGAIDSQFNGPNSYNGGESRLIRRARRASYDEAIRSNKDQESIMHRLAPLAWSAIYVSLVSAATWLLVASELLENAPFFPLR